MTYAVLAANILISLVFLAAGTAKMLSAPMEEGIFEAIGLGQRFRYLTGAIEIASVILLWMPGRQAIWARLLVCTMIGAGIAHVVVLGPSVVPAIVLTCWSSFCGSTVVN